MTKSEHRIPTSRKGIDAALRRGIPAWLKPAEPATNVLDATAAVVPRSTKESNPGQGYFAQTALAMFNQAGGVFRYRASNQGTPATPKRRLSRSCIPQRIGRRLTTAQWFWRCFIEGSIA
jgi:hypothetical protein